MQPDSPPQQITNPKRMDAQMEPLVALANLSRQYASGNRYVFLGGGNTSYKDSSTLYIKPSGVALATLQPGDFVHLDRGALRTLFSADLPADTWEREAAVKQLVGAAVRSPAAARPSVETPVHEVIDYAFVVHLHPTAVNGLTCAMNGKQACAALFPEALWLDYCNPGCTLSFAVRAALQEAVRSRGKQPQVIMLQNHGVFVGADTLDEIEAIYTHLLTTLAAAYTRADISTDLQTYQDVPDRTSLLHSAPRLRALLGEDGHHASVSCLPPFAPAAGPLTPDHIVYAKSFALTAEMPAVPSSVAAFVERHGYAPRVISLPQKAVFCAGASLADATAVGVAARDAALVAQYTAAFGGPRFLSADQYRFIENWEAESYRRSMGANTAAQGRLSGRVCVVTGAAQGFGRGIARHLAEAGGTIVVADLNAEGAAEAAAELNRDFGPHTACSTPVDIAAESSVADMVARITETCGGIDLFVANAGVLKAASVKEMSLADWELVTAVNYTGYFLCVKYVAPVMAAQNACNPDSWSDIVQINSKSGLEGSNRNGAYAGSKFGTIGLTQSFAKELVEDHIKVNSICPGNFFAGPLWSDPQKGLFVQYLQTGKVPGATSIDDVRQAYESKIPMGRGCTPTDVARAILYCVEQEYETGQAIPVTGGQVMLH